MRSTQRNILSIQPINPKPWTITTTPVTEEGPKAIRNATKTKKRLNKIKKKELSITIPSMTTTIEERDDIPTLSNSDDSRNNIIPTSTSNPSSKINQSRNNVNSDSTSSSNLNELITTEQSNRRSPRLNVNDEARTIANNTKSISVLNAIDSTTKEQKRRSPRLQQTLENLQLQNATNSNIQRSDINDNNSTTTINATINTTNDTATGNA